MKKARPAKDIDEYIASFPDDVQAILDKVRKFAEFVSLAAGTLWAFIVALAVFVGWAICGPFVGFSEHWNLMVNSFTTIVTFLMVFIIQNTQNRDFKALQLKLDELLRASDNTHRRMINLHNLPDEDLHRLAGAFKRFGGQHNIAEIVRSLEKSSDANQSAHGQAG